MSTVKRLFLYIVAIINLGIFAGGAGTLLTLVLDLLSEDSTWRSYSQEKLAIGLAMLVIGGVLWFLFWRIIRREVSGDAAETGSGIRKLYLNLILTVSAISGLSNLAGFLGWMLAGVKMAEFPSDNLASLIVAGCFWFYHRRVERNEGQPSPDARTLGRWYVYILSAFGLVSLTVAIIQIINSSVMYLPVWGEYTIQKGIWEGALAPGIAFMITGGMAWWYHWFRLAKGDSESTLRQVYLYLLTISGGAIAALVALVTSIYRLLILAFNGTTEEMYLRFLGWTIPTAITGAAVWLYHRKAAQEEAASLKIDRLSPHRLYMYLMSFIGLGAMLTGIAFLFSVLLDLLFDSFSSTTIFYSGWWGQQLGLSLALLLAGIPVWLYFWRKTLKMVDEGGVAERSARSRRIYLYAVLGLAIIAAVTTLVLIIYQVISGILKSTFDGQFYQNIIWSLAVLLAAAPALVYHWRVLREDQRLGAEKLIRRKRVNVIAPEGAGELVSRIEENLGYRVRRLAYTGEVAGEVPALTDEEIGTMVGSIGTAAGDGVVISITGAGVTLLPYEEK